MLIAVNAIDVVSVFLYDSSLYKPMYTATKKVLLSKSEDYSFWDCEMVQLNIDGQQIVMNFP